MCMLSKSLHNLVSVCNDLDIIHIVLIPIVYLFTEFHIFINPFQDNNYIHLENMNVY